MSFDDDWPDETIEARRTMVRQTIRLATYDELKALCERTFTIVTDPWFVRFNGFLESHKDSKFYHANAPGDAEVIYCRESEKGVWVIPGTGMGIIQPKGLKVLAEIVDSL